jgi:very-short-patch-repair endonuclease
MPDRIARARELRRSATDAERVMWRALRENFPQLRFRRQYPVGPFIVDFYCHALKLGIEVDGGQHLEPENAAYDGHRTDYLASRGLQIIRFDNLQVLTDTDAVLTALEEAISALRTPAPPSP